MCTAVSYETKNHYFGRNLDLECSSGENVVITPRDYPLTFRTKDTLKHHYAIIGTGIIIDGYPLYYDASNEKGLSMAGLNFPGMADYKACAGGKDNIAPFEFIPWILGQCSNIKEAEALLKNINIANIDFSSDIPSHPLHWIIDGRGGSIVAEPVKDGLKVYDNPVGVLTNNPCFDFHITNLNNYIGISASEPENRFSEKLDLKPLSRGMGAVGLPGDNSSVSRFVRASFVKLNSVPGETENEDIMQFFHILSSVYQQKGCTRIGGGKYEITQYSSCCDTDNGIYYYKTYFGSGINAVNMHRENLDSSRLISYPFIKDFEAVFHNQGK